MKRLAWLLLLSVVTIRPASAQASKMLEVTLRSRSSLCKINDNLELEIIRENVGSHDLVVPRRWRGEEVGQISGCMTTKARRQRQRGGYNLLGR
jgi:hypothetical protein